VNGLGKLVRPDGVPKKPRLVALRRRPVRQYPAVFALIRFMVVPRMSLANIEAVGPPHPNVESLSFLSGRDVLGEPLEHSFPAFARARRSHVAIREASVRDA